MQQIIVIIMGEEERHWQKNFVRTLDRSSSEIYRYDEWGAQGPGREGDISV